MKNSARPDMTLQLLWHEYQEQHPQGYRYSQFCELYRRWAKKLDWCLRQEHRAGEKLFVDFSGQGIPVTHPETGEVTFHTLFVAVWGASNYTYAEACLSEELPTGSAPMSGLLVSSAVCPRSWFPII